MVSLKTSIKAVCISTTATGFIHKVEISHAFACPNQFGQIGRAGMCNMVQEQEQGVGTGPNQ